MIEWTTYITKDPSKQEGSNVCWDARFFNPVFLNLNQLPAAKKVFKKRASLQMLGPSYFVRALVKMKNSEMRIQTSFGQFVRFSPSLLD